MSIATLVDLWLSAQLEANAQAQALQQHRQQQAQRFASNNITTRKKRPRQPLGDADVNTLTYAPVSKNMRATRASSPSKAATAQAPEHLEMPDSTAASTQSNAATSSTRPQSMRRSQRQRTSHGIKPTTTAASRPPQLPPPATLVDNLGQQLARQLELDQEGPLADKQHDHAVRSYAAQLHGAASSSSSSRVPSCEPSSPSKDSDRTTDTRVSRSTTTGRSRLRSPVKKISDMSLLDKPCVAMSWSEASRADVLDVDSVLRRDLEEISQNDRPVVPRAIEEDLRSVLGNNFYIPARVFGDLGHDLKKATREFDTIKDIVEEADRCVTRQCCEAQWNAEVHSRVLKLALAPYAGRAEYNCITSAAPLDDLVPTVGNTRVQTKYIDYSIQLVPTSTAFQNAIRERLRQQLQDDVGGSTRSAAGGGGGGLTNPPTINQSGYFPIHDRPLAISIETKTPEAGEGGALAQLAVWISCGHRRVYQLTGTSPGTLRLPSLPVLRVVGHAWTLGFAIDMGDKIALVNFPHEIGHTRTIVGAYRLLAILRRVVEWADGPYREWFGRVVLGLDSGSV
ncbi:uncharacterized protein B0I36DRAFT_362391 [Microdochium trichocladiopsis]|uniref:PD-(D/E)XK nuclease-like domain-containing protein n=1 Tax=Microdochium trichocladiopsis TaxID=1682393 RepID=A0A9P8Y5H7_9PEZI|nr:uncharacterized protein B0I36DRAFT_362391 [Microdochium trichocladiopsis]KAH7030550.1 hypothetical protein B0I36DRAFT_362391 [Microdochium trichocladiopsis]